MLRRDRGEVVERFVDAGRQTRRSHVVSKNALVRDMREKARLGSHFIQHVRDVFLAFRSKGLLVSGAAAEGDHNHLALFAHGLRTHKRTRLHQRSAERQTSSVPQKLSPGSTDGSRNLQSI